MRTRRLQTLMTTTPHAPTRIALGLTLLLPLLLTACSSPSTAGGASGSAAAPGTSVPAGASGSTDATEVPEEDADPCAVVTADDVAALTKRPYVRSEGGTSEVAPGLTGAGCNYLGASQDPSKVMMLTVYDFPTGGQKAITFVNDLMEAAAPTTPFSGTGDEAFGDDNGVTVRWGDHVVVVLDAAFPTGSAPVTRAMLSEIAQRLHDAR